MSTDTEHQVWEGEIGFVVEAKGYLLALEGLPSARINNVIVNSKGQRALVTALREESVEALLLDRGNVSSGDRFMLSQDGIMYSFGEQLFGRVINAVGEPIDDGDAFGAKNTPLFLDVDAPTMSARAPMTTQLNTGMSAVDVLMPIAKGQRQLIIGPIASGKNLFLESLFANQATTEVICIYAFIGRPVEYVEDSITRIFSEKGNHRSIIIASFSDEPASIIYLTPLVAVELAEYFSHDGKDVIVVLDDLGTHARYLREIALLSGRVPGRESYPGDLFFQQASMLERGGRFNKTMGSGSITMLPVLETNIEDISSLVSTNIISATDGHLFFSPLRHAEGVFPAIIPDASVTRVGRKTQNTLTTQLSLRVQALLAEHERQQRYSQFGTQLSQKTRRIIARGQILRVLLSQEQMSAIPLEAQVVLLSLVFTTFFDDKDVAFATRFRRALTDAVMRADADPVAGPVVVSARRGSMSLDQFLRKLSEALPYFTAVCQ